MRPERVPVIPLGEFRERPVLRKERNQAMLCVLVWLVSHRYEGGPTLGTGPP